jgi:hypothetical protein
MVIVTVFFTARTSLGDLQLDDRMSFGNRQRHAPLVEARARLRVSDDHFRDHERHLADEGQRLAKATLNLFPVARDVKS